MEDGGLTLNDVTIKDNISVNGASGGGGVRILNSDINLNTVIFEGNTANSGPGGALYLEGSETVCTVVNSIFDGNYSASDGSGIHNENTSLSISESIFRNNTAGSGGAISTLVAGFTMTNSLMHDNSGADGGAIKCNGSNTTLTNCTIVGNNDTQLSGLNSSGILVHTLNSTFTIVNSIIWDNVINFDDSDGGTLNISYSDIEGGESGILLSDNNTGTLNWGDGNLNINPIFTDSENSDYSLSPYSQLIASGLLNSAPPVDITGGIRPNPSGSNPDLGAFESELGTFEDITNYCVSTLGSNSGTGFFDDPLLTIQSAIAFASDGDTVSVSNGVYYENLDLNGKSLTLIGESREQTMINGGNNGPVILINDPVTGVVKIKGFDISGGMGLMGGEPNAPEISVGGGIFALYNNVHLEDLKITGNTAHTGGGAFIYSSDASQEDLIMKNVIFDGNTAIDDAGSSALMFQASDQNLKIINCIFDGNQSSNPNQGRITASIFGGNFSLVMDSTDFISNTGQLELYGGGGGNDFTIRNSTFNGIQTANTGGALALRGTYIADIEFCQFINNQTYGFGGGALKIENEGNVTISNCNFLNNQAHETEGGAISITKVGSNQSENGPMVSIINSIFTNNTAQKAGAIYVEDGGLTLNDVNISTNSSTYGGGGLRTRYSTLSLTDVSFDQNNANGGPGGGLFLDGLGSDSEPVFVDNCIFSGNFSASDGSAINSAGQNMTIDGSIFSDNITEGGGAIASVVVGFTMTNSLMHNNSGADGGAIMCNGSNTTLTNCTIVGNNDTEVSPGLNSSAILVTTENSSFTIVNSIIWDNVINFDDYDGGTLNISYSDIEGGESGVLLSDNNTGTLNWGDGNLNQNPLFCEIGNDNYTLFFLSPCISNGFNGADIGAFEIGCEFIDLDPPSITFNEITDVGTGDSLELNWDIEDVSEIGLIELMVTYDTLGTIYPLVTLNGESNTYTYFAPESLVTSVGKLIINAVDINGNSSSDTSNTFQIFDAISPEVSILFPDTGFSIPEHTPFLVEWSHSDNIEVFEHVFEYANNGETFDTLLTTNSFENIYEQDFQVNGVTELGTIRLTVLDRNGNQTTTLSNPFSVTDNTPPSITFNEITDVGTGDSLELNWDIEDVSEIGLIELMVTYDTLGTIYPLVTLNGESNTYTYFAPESLVTSVGKLIINAVDINGNSSSDTSNTFQIFDAISPEVSILFPDTGFSIPEHTPFLVEWSHSDNIEVFEHVFEYANNGETFDTLLTTNSFENIYEQDFQVNGVTELGTIRLTVLDRNGNQTTTLSNPFSVTDNTPPMIEISSPYNGVGFNIGDSVQITWSDYDNVGVEFVNIYYSIGSDWYIIDEIIENNNFFNWIVPNEPTENLQIRVVGLDVAGLSDTSVVEDLSINIIYPKVIDIHPEPGMVSYRTNEIYIQFSQEINLNTISESNLEVLSSNGFTIQPSLTWIDSSSIILFSFDDILPSFDSISISLSNELISNYGYPLDGNSDGIGGDGTIILYTTSIIADYDQDMEITISDLSQFVINWENQNIDQELGPYLGSIPNVQIVPDGKYNYYDMGTFAMIWNWYSSINSIAFSDYENEGQTISYMASNDSIIIELPLDLSAYQIQFQYDPNMLTFGTLDKNEGIILTNQNQDLGVFTIMAQGGDKKLLIPINMINNISEINMGYKGYTNNGSISGIMTKKIKLEEIPESFVLHDNYPNPFNPITKIDFGLPKEVYVELVIFDILGREVVTLVNGLQEPGYKTVTWNGADTYGKRVSAGMYFYMIQAGNNRQIKKMILLK